MPIDGRSAAAGHDPVPMPVVAVLAALRVERASLERARARSVRGLIVTQTGPGPENAARAADGALAAGAAALVSFGLAGALAPTLRAGAVVLPRAIVAASGERFVVDSAWRDAIATMLGAEFAPADGDMLSVPEPLATPDDKARAGSGGGVAVDMESAAIAAAAARSGVPCVAIRVVVDEAGDALPSGTERLVDARGEQRLGAAVGAALRPAGWSSFLMLARRYRVARRTLDRLAGLLVAQRFCGAAVTSAAKVR